MKALAKILLVPVFLFPLACAKKDPGTVVVEGPATPAEKKTGYEFVLKDTRWPDRTFVVEMPLTNTEGVKSFEGYLSEAAVTKDPSGNPAVGILSGTVVKCAAGERHKWPYCLEPGTIHFDDMTTEVCDGDFSYLETHLDDWMNSVKTYCPWQTTALIQTIKKGDVVLYQRAAENEP